jgi:hypothetical protein
LGRVEATKPQGTRVSRKSDQISRKEARANEPKSIRGPFFPWERRCESIVMDLGHVFQSRVLRRLFSHEVCSRIRHEGLFPPRRPGSSWLSSRSYSNDSAPDSNSRRESNWQQRTAILPPDKSKEFSKYPAVTAQDLRLRKERPKRVKMPMRDFIEGSPSDRTHPPRAPSTDGDQTVSTTPAMVTSRSRWPYSALERHSTSTT